MKPTPIKRNEHLKPISREHHQGLLLCWKIRTGISKNVPIDRIKTYTDWFYKEHLLPHFELEEKHLFPILDEQHEMVTKAKAEHRRLKRLFEAKNELEKKISLIEEELESHIRFEERVLFNEIQTVATPEQLQHIDEIHQEEKFVENQTDPFWE